MEYLYFILKPSLISLKHISKISYNLIHYELINHLKPEALRSILGFRVNVITGVTPSFVCWSFKDSFIAAGRFRFTKCSKIIFCSIITHWKNRYLTRRLSTLSTKLHRNDHYCAIKFNMKRFWMRSFHVVHKPLCQSILQFIHDAIKNERIQKVKQ